MRRILTLCVLFGGLLATVGNVSNDRESAQEIERARKPKLPNSWFSRQRLSGGEIPVAARARALARKNESLDGLGAAATVGSWQQAGPANIGGRVTALAVDPNDVDRVWLGTADGGVWLSDDAGTVWSPRFEDQTAQSIGSLATHPTDSNIVYAGGGEDNGAGYSYDGEGVLKSTDGGATWQSMGLAATRRIGSIAIDPTTPDTVFACAGGNVFSAGADRGVYRSTDGGANWTKVLFVANDTGCIEVEIDPAQPGRIYAAMWTRLSSSTSVVLGGNAGGIWQSVDGGDNWTQLAAGLPTTDIGRIGLAVAPSSPNVVYARYQTATGDFKGIWKSTNSGASWTKVDGSGIWRFFLASYGYYFGEIRVDPLDADTVFLLDLYWFRSTNGGVGFQQFTSGLHVDHHDLILQPGRMLMGNDGGFWWSTNSGSSWTQSQDLPISQAYDIAIDTIDPNRQFTGLQDNGTVRTTTGSLGDWAEVNGGDGLQCEVDPTNSNFVYASSQGGNFVRSIDGGDSFSGGTNGIGNERTNWNAPLEHDPLTTQRLYTGTYRIYRTIDGAQNWSVVSPDLTDPTDGGSLLFERDRGDPPRAHLEDLVGRTVTTIDVSPVDTTIVWAGTDDGNIWVTSDDSVSWTQVNIPGRDEWVTRVSGDFFDANTAYASFSGFRDGDRASHVFRTRDLGQTWVDISGDLPNVPLNDVIPDPDWEGRLFAGTDLGVYISDSDGLHWEDVGSGMPIVVVHDIVLDDNSRQLWAGTHARSLWSFDLMQLPVPDRDLDGFDNLSDCAPQDGGAHTIPGEINGVAWDADKQTLRWNSAAPGSGSGALHDVLRGRIDELPVGGGAAETCTGTGLSADFLTEIDIPASGVARWYLVRGRNVCGDGGYGTASDLTVRLSNICP